MSKKKKIVILSCMVLLLAVTAVCNFLLTNKSDGNTVATANYFTEYRTEHTKTLNEQILRLDAIISDADADSQAKEDALRTKLRLSEIIEKELYLESIIKAKGYKNAVVMIGTNSENITVVVEDKDFTSDDAVSIYTVLADEVKASPENVRIFPLS